MEIKRINIIGFGNVGKSLFSHLDKKVNIKSLFTRSSDDKLRRFSNNKLVTDLEFLSKDVDLNIIATTDSAILKVIHFLPKNIPIVHTSGSIDMDVLKSFQYYGVLYPLQTFTKGRYLDLSTVPFLLETNSEVFGKDLALFTKEYLTKKVTFCNSLDRENIHVAAVFINNFTTLMAREAKQLLSKNNQDFSILEPLFKETVDKILALTPDESQTGPAQRGDRLIIKKHIDSITHIKQKEVYEILSNRIIELRG